MIIMDNCVEEWCQCAETSCYAIAGVQVVDVCVLSSVVSSSGNGEREIDFISI